MIVIARFFFLTQNSDLFSIFTFPMIGPLDGNIWMFLMLTTASTSEKSL